MDKDPKLINEKLERNEELLESQRQEAKENIERMMREDNERQSLLNYQNEMNELSSRLRRLGFN